MSDPARSSTLLVFTLGARRERARRRLLPRRHAAWELALHRGCLASTIDAGRRAGCRVVVSSPGPLPELPAGVEHRAQRGRGFGPRLRAAIADLDPHRPWVVVGSDAPGLGPPEVARALRLLAAEPAAVVIGPATDGGFYLLAARRPLDGALAEVDWLSRRTRASLCAALARRGIPVRTLPALRDLDRRADLERWLSGAAGVLDALGAALARLLRTDCRPPVAAVVRVPGATRFRPILGRAPPR